MNGRDAASAPPRRPRPVLGLRRRPSSGEEGAAADAEGVAASVQRIAVLLQAGIAPRRAWEHLATSGDPAARTAVTRIADGAALGDAIARGGGAWCDVAIAWRVAETVGAPLAHSLRTIAEALREAEASRDDVRVALAEPAATARLIAWLPLVAVALSAALGFDVVRTLGHPVGVACVLAGAMLMLAAHRWTARLVRRAQPPSAVPGLRAELVAVALTGGVSIDRALAVVDEAEEAVRALDVEAGRADPRRAPRRRRSARSDAVVSADDDLSTDVPSILALSRTAGAPAVELLRGAAALDRHRSRTEGRLRAARLSSRLLLPLGVCTLPAFLTLGVAPMLLSVVSSSVLTF